MAVYVDAAIWPLDGRLWCHLLADDIAELHRFAALLGLKLLSYQGPPRTAHPHYDITSYERDLAVRLGARPITRRQTVMLIRRLKREAEKDAAASSSGPR
ncbi:DUF4031 domain-containing protein [Salmonella enterica subsp. enterica serovar Virchow]|nr:DUF4031 domain-containing protein [Salmonella enterica subsp. enterica serovar Virchow]MIL09847.1 DUF4031 domain-containing protein [Salmonella enterica subsp. enterica serovar Enteritidis]